MHKISVIPRPQNPARASVHKISVIPRPQKPVYSWVESVAEPETAPTQDAYDLEPSDVVLGQLAAYFFLKLADGHGPMTDEVPSDRFQIDELAVDIVSFE